MPHLTVLLSAVLFLYLRFRHTVNIRLLAKRNELQALNNEQEVLLGQNKKLKTGNASLQQFAQETIALYDITKDMCKTLDEAKIFSIFRSGIGKYVKVLDCKFIKSEENAASHENETLMPLAINNKRIGYLSAVGINKDDRDKFQILGQQFLLAIKRSLLYQRIQELAITDSLTQIFTRRYFLEKFNEEIERSRKFNYNLSFLMIDIDRFKDCNDHYGHLVGDAVLREISKAIKESMRQIDFIGRFGGEELSVVLTETDKEQAFLAAERIRRAIESKAISPYDEALRITISIGISTFPSDSAEAKKIIDKADQALYRAKESGRNKTCTCAH